MIDGNEVIHHNYADIGIVVRKRIDGSIGKPELMSFKEIESEIKRLILKTEKANYNQWNDRRNFTITSGGVFGSMLSLIINPPQSAILGITILLKDLL